MFNTMRVLCKAMTRVLGFGVWLWVEHPKGSKGLCAGVNNN